MLSTFNACLLGLVMLSRVSLVDGADDSLGRWGEVFNMEVIPIHVILLPGGYVLSYGANKKAKQGGNGDYEVWDTSTGEHGLAENHVLMRHSTKVNTFCSTLSMDVSTGNILIMGGDDEFNNGVNDVLEFNIETHEIIDHPLGDMKYARWYGTSINLADGTVFITGGESGLKKIASAVPEVFHPGKGFRELPGATMPALTFKRGGMRAWWYPHAFVNSQGDIVVIMSDWKNFDCYRVGVEGRGSIEKTGERPFVSDKLGPSIMYDVDQVVMMDATGGLWKVDISDSSKPVFIDLGVDLGPNRMNSAMAMLPDGRVIINGGTSETGDTTGLKTEFATKYVQIWDPVTNTVFKGPNQAIPRLYHSSSLILPDGSVYSGGGGAPGPLKNHNGQIYYPGYWFDPRTGEKATRLEIQAGPHNIEAGDTFRIVVDDATKVARVTATKSGSMTHARNCDARWVNLPFTFVGGRTIEVSTFGPTIMIPGLWNLNVLDTNDVPSEARLIGVSMAPLGPTLSPSISPSSIPTSTPSTIPSTIPSTTPSTSPSAMPSLRPSEMPTGSPTGAPTAAPTDLPLTLAKANNGSVATGRSNAVAYAVPAAIVSFLLMFG